MSLFLYLPLAFSISTSAISTSSLRFGQKISTFCARCRQIPIFKIWFFISNCDSSRYFRTINRLLNWKLSHHRDSNHGPPVFATGALSVWPWWLASTDVLQARGWNPAGHYRYPRAFSLQSVTHSVSVSTTPPSGTYQSTPLHNLSITHREAPCSLMWEYVKLVIHFKLWLK